MAPRKKGGRATAEARFAALMKDQTALVGNVGDAWEEFAASLAATEAKRERYETARAAAVKAQAVSNDQLDQMGYKRAPKLPALPAGSVGVGEQSTNGDGAASDSVSQHDQNHQVSAASAAHHNGEH